jgi:hypothetical protein
VGIDVDVAPRVPRPLVACTVALALALAACGGPTKTGTTAARSSPAPSSSVTASSSTSAPSATGGAPCGRTSTRAAAYAHVVWIWMENHTAEQVIGSSSAPYETSLARQCGTAQRYAAVGSPSLPNYIGATSGTTAGIADDGSPGDHRVTADNLFRQVRAAGKTERSYEESMPAPCSLDSSGSYAVKHNPAAYYAGGDDRAACQADDVPLGTADAGALVRDLTSGSLPAFSFITPDLCDDTHDCSVATGDRWLSEWVPRIVDSRSYAAGNTALFIVWDEPTPMPLIVVSPSTPAGTVASGSFSHYSLLRTTEEVLGLPLLGGATSAPSMRDPFHL